MSFDDRTQRERTRERINFFHLENRCSILFVLRILTFFFLLSIQVKSSRDSFRYKINNERLINIHCFLSKDEYQQSAGELDQATFFFFVFSPSSSSSLAFDW